MAHLDNCLRVTHEGRARGFNPSLGIVYDDICRKTWAGMARSGLIGFDINAVSLGIDTDLVKRAEAALTASEGKKARAAFARWCSPNYGFCCAGWANQGRHR